MKNSKLCPKDRSLLQSLKEENKNLKQEIAKLKKQIDRIDPNDIRLNNIQKTTQKFEQKQMILTHNVKNQEYKINLEELNKNVNKLIFEDIHPIE